MPHLLKTVKVIKAAMAPTTGCTCRWPGCKTARLPHQWGCTKHWSYLPMPLRLQYEDLLSPGKPLPKELPPALNRWEQTVMSWIAENYPAVFWTQPRGTAPSMRG